MSDQLAVRGIEIYAHHGVFDFERRDGQIFVIDLVLGMVDSVLYLAGGRFRAGTPDEVLRSDVLTVLYGTPVDVLRTRGRIVVVGIPDAETHEHHDHSRDAHPEPAA